MKVYSYSLQGKRDANEDQHVHILNLNGENSELNNINFFGVFDGHGGKLVSKYLLNNLPNYLLNNDINFEIEKINIINEKILNYFEYIQSELEK